MYFKDKILPSLITALLIGIFGLLLKMYLVINSFPDMVEDNRTQHDRYEELFQQEIDKRVILEKEVLILKTKLEK